MDTPEQSLVDSTAATAALAPETPGATQELSADPSDAGAASPPTPEDENTALLALLPAEDGTEEIEWEGKKHKIPAELKSALMAHADYTRKTQEVAEQRRQIEAQAAEQQRQIEFHRAHLTEVAQVVSIDNQLAEYDKLDWPALIAQNAQQAMLLDQQRRELQAKKGQLVQSLQQKEREGLEAQRQMSARRVEETQREIAREIRDWSPDLAKKLTDYGRGAGFPAEVLTPAAPAAFVKTLHKAMQWDQLLAQRNAKPAATPDKPVTRVGARASPATRSLEDMTPDDFRRERDRQLAQRNKRR